MSTVGRKRTANRKRSDQEELAHRIALALPNDGTIQAQPGLSFIRSSRPGAFADHGLCKPMFCVIAQGSEKVYLGEHTFRYDPTQCLLTTVELPLSWQVVEASPKKPFLGLRLVLDPSVVTSVMVKSGLPLPADGSSVRGLDVSPLDSDLLNATLRLVRLGRKSAQHRKLAIREIIHRLLTSAQGNRLRLLAKSSGQTQRLVRSIRTICENAIEELPIEELAKGARMSILGFYAHFRAVTTMSPLQFQKQLRFLEARRMMLRQKLEAAEAGYRIGYDDASQFSREYKRHFGRPPMRDVKHLRARGSA